MSQKNVEIVQRCLETYETDQDAWLETLDPELEWHPIGDGHIRRVGHEARRRRPQALARQLGRSSGRKSRR